MQMTGRGAVGNHRNRKVCRVGWEIHDLYVENGGEAAEALCADAEAVDLVVDVDAQLFDLGLGAAGDELLHVDWVHQRFFGHDHGFFRRCHLCRYLTFRGDTSLRPCRGRFSTPTQRPSPRG